MANKSEIIIYKAEDGSTEIDVRIEKDSVWLSQLQMAILFDQTKQNISLHIHNIFKENELNRNSVVKDYLTTAADGKQYKTNYYNLDVVISVGYRVRSKRGTEFRIWATKLLQQFLIKGYVLNEKRLKEQSQMQLKDLQRTVKLIQSIAVQQKLSSEEASGLLNVIADYTLALDVLDQFDHQQLKINYTERNNKFRIDYPQAKNAIDTLREKFHSTSLFGMEKDDSFKSSLNTIYQTFDKNELYPSVEEKAAHLLYFVIKNHSFVDGNKRIAAFLFVWFIERNGLLYRQDGNKRIADNALVALTLLIAASKPEEMEVMVKVVVNLINKSN
ncbi:MAG: virulence protein RhuM/Fic/DOC family protein [Bacteroidetes bacterium]|nr:virulence protein RhuM/Fic/DOC family protein [Bacteroidota bacterium]